MAALLERIPIKNYRQDDLYQNDYGSDINSLKGGHGRMQLRQAQCRG